MHLPGGPGVRVDSAAYQGYKIPPFYDSMIGKLIVYGADRQQAIVRMRRALAETLFEGVVTAPTIRCTSCARRRLWTQTLTLIPSQTAILTKSFIMV